MDEIKKRVYLDLLVSPESLVPAMLGATGLLLTWANEGPAWLGFGSVCVGLAGFGVMAMKFLFGLDKAVQRAKDKVEEQQREEQAQIEHEKQRVLDNLMDKLYQTGDRRVTDALINLRAINTEFTKGLSDGKISPVAQSVVVESVTALFNGCIKQLEKSWDLWIAARSLRGSPRKTVLDQRESVVEEVVKSVEELGKTVDHCWAMSQGSEQNHLGELRKELEQSLEVAKRTQERMSQLGLRTNREND